MGVFLGVDFHARTQTVCWCDTADGVVQQRTLDHRREDVRALPTVSSSGRRRIGSHWIRPLVPPAGGGKETALLFHVCRRLSPTGSKESWSANRGRPSGRA